MSRRRFIDWRFLFSLALLLLVAFLVFSGVEAARDNRAKGERIDVLVAELQRQHADAEADRRSASDERAQLLAGQHQLEQKYDVLIERQGALLVYLRKHGIEVPPRFIVTTRTVTGGRSGTSRRTASGATSGATSPPAATAPGKSGGKGRAHHRRHRR